MGESTSRETAIAAGAAAIVKGWLGSDARVDAVTYAVACYDAFVAAQAVIPIEEHEAALARLRNETPEAVVTVQNLKADIAALAETLRETAAGYAIQKAKLTAALSLLRGAHGYITSGRCDEEPWPYWSKDAAAALADTQHPSTPGGTE